MLLDFFPSNFCNVRHKFQCCTRHQIYRSHGSCWFQNDEGDIRHCNATNKDQMWKRCFTYATLNHFRPDSNVRNIVTLETFTTYTYEVYNQVLQIIIGWNKWEDRCRSLASFGLPLLSLSAAITSQQQLVGQCCCERYF